MSILDRIILFSLRYRTIVAALAILIAGLGIIVTSRTEVDVFPDLNAPTVAIMTEAPGMAPEEVEQLVSFPIETSMTGSAGVRRVRSTSSAGFSVVWVEFDWDTDIYRARQIVGEKLAAASDALPEGVGTPVMGAQSSILGEMLIVGLTSGKTSLMDLRSIAERDLKPRLQAAEGVAQVSVIGGDLMEYQIFLSPARMRSHGVTLQDVLAATRGMTTPANGGVLYDFGNEYLIRGMTPPELIETLRNAVVAPGVNNAGNAENIDNSVRTNDSNGSGGGMPVVLADIAEVTVGGESPRLGVASERGCPAVLLTVTKQPGAGTISLTERLENILSEASRSLPEDIHISTDIFRQADFIQGSIANVRTSLWEGALFVVIILFLFLGNVRTTLISLVTIPVALLVALIVLRLLGETLNTMSLGGLAIAIGSLVDDAIVDVENVWRRLRLNRQLPPEERLESRQVVFEASREVRMPILNSTLIIIVSFLPLFFLQGMEGRMLIPLGIAFIAALVASTIVALTLTPALCSWLLTHPSARKEEERFDKDSRLSLWLKQKYEIALRWTLSHARALTISAAALFIASIAIFFTLGHSFLPPFNEGSLTINVSTLPGASLEESDKIGSRAEQILMEIPEILTVARKTGRAELDEHALGVNVSELEAPFELKERSREEFLKDVRSRLGTIPGANVEIGQPISHRIDAMLSGTQAAIAIKIFGKDLTTLRQTAADVSRAIEGVEGLADLNIEQQIERPEIKIIPRPQMLARFGMTLPEFNECVGVLLGGERIAEVYQGGRSYGLTLRADSASRSSIEALGRIEILTPSGSGVELADIAEIRSTSGPNSISRENAERKIVVSANSAGRDVGSIVDDIRERVEKGVLLPESYHIEYGGQFESEREASRTLLLNSLLAILAIWLLLYLQFRNVKESGVILLNLPFALIGGVIVLRLTSGEVSIPAIIGFISLFGIATRNGMLLITRYNLLRDEEKLPPRECVMRGSADRLNPILMTALTSALALLPLAMRGDLPGNEIQSPMAMVILGGLLTSTLLNAFIIPIIWLWMQHPQSFIHRGKLSGVSSGVTVSILLVMASALMPAEAFGESGARISEVITAIERNNPALKASAASAEAEGQALGVENTLPAIGIEYSPFFRSGATGVASSELIVQQEFDFPTLYAARAKSAGAEREALRAATLTIRREMLQQARLLCLDIIMQQEVDGILQRQADATSSLLALYQKRLELGTATILEVNKIRLEMEELARQQVECHATRRSMLRELQALNGGAPLPGDTLRHDLTCAELLAHLSEACATPSATPSIGLDPNVRARLSEAPATPSIRLDPNVQAAEAKVEAARRNLSLSKQSWLPALSVGYRRNTELGEASNGLLVGASFPIYSAGKERKAAGARLAAEELNLAAAEMEAESRIANAREELEMLAATLRAYDSTLLYSTLELYQKSMEAGQISLTDYYAETSILYTRLQTRLELETRLRKAALPLINAVLPLIFE